MLQWQGAYILHSDLMPVAEPFSTRGKIGTGFPFCFTKIDKTLFTYAVDMTLEQASAFYYNVYSVAHPTITAVDDGNETPYTATIPAGDFLIGTRLIEEEGAGSDATITPPPEPSTHVCSPLTSYHQNFASPSVVSVGISLTTPQIVKFYDGDITNEDNHTGWGVDNVLSIHAGIQAFDVNQIIYRSYGEEIAWVPDPEDPFGQSSWWWDKGFLGDSFISDAVPDSVTETTLAGVPILKCAYTERDGEDNTWTVAEPTGVEFYTYP